MRRTAPAYDPAAIADGLDRLVEILAGLRTRLMRAGFSEDAAEQICVQQHAGMVEEHLDRK